MPKNKSKKKWNKSREFYRKKSTRRQVGHPVFVYGKSGRFFKYLTFTHKPEIGKEEHYEKLKYNIDPTDGESSYVKKMFDISEKNSFRPPDKKYRIHDDDRDTIKKYKK